MKLKSKTKKTILVIVVLLISIAILLMRTIPFRTTSFITSGCYANALPRESNSVERSFRVISGETDDYDKEVKQIRSDNKPQDTKVGCEYDFITLKLYIL